MRARLTSKRKPMSNTCRLGRIERHARVVSWVAIRVAATMKGSANAKVLVPRNDSSG